MTTAMATTAQEANIQDIAHLIKSNQVQRIVLVTGAGISTAAGIPDFRSPNTGLYAKLASLKLLPYPEAIFSINYFRHTPEPFYAIASARHPRNLKPTLTHAFLGLLEKKNLLHFIFTQNIDGLEQDAGVPADKVLNVHGSWKSQHCYKCQAGYPDDLMRKAINQGIVPYCVEEGCGGVVKPDVVFFGQPVSESFARLEEEKIAEADLFIVMGTSLKVAPVSAVPRKVPEGVPRVLVNNERVGDMGTRAGDVCILGGCDEGVGRLADALGWREELEEFWREVVQKKEELQQQEDDDGGPELSIDESIARLAEKMRADRLVSEGHRSMLEHHLEEKFAGLLQRKENI